MISLRGRKRPEPGPYWSPYSNSSIPERRVIYYPLAVQSLRNECTFLSGKKQFYHQSLLQAFHKISRSRKRQEKCQERFFFPVTKIRKQNFK